nr:hypothetical protein [Halomonas sp. 1513]
MDFIWCSDKSKIASLEKGFLSVGYIPESIVFSSHGEWGAIIAVKSCYTGLDPYEDEEFICVVVGDPLIDKGETKKLGSSVQSSCRSKRIADIWGEGGKNKNIMVPEHPAAIVCINKKIKKSEVYTDILGAVPVYSAISEGAVFLSSSPDIIAAILGPPIDKISGVELVVNGRINYPYTLYDGIVQLAPGALYTLPDLAFEKLWVPPSCVEDTSAEEWGALIKEELQLFFRGMAVLLGESGATTLSAGKDTRMISQLASSCMRLDAVTLYPVKNIDYYITSLVAKKIGIKLNGVLRSPSHYSELYRSRPVGITTQNLWGDAHFHNRVLGEHLNTPFILGGYLGDAFLRGNSIYNKRRLQAIKRKEINSTSYDWVINEMGATLSGEIANAINTRYYQASTMLGLGIEHRNDMVNNYPFTSILSAAHFHAARRYGPHYEPFMSRKLVEIAFKIPLHLKKDELQNSLYSSVGVGFSRKIFCVSLLNKFANRLGVIVPGKYQPKWLKYQGSWSYLVSPYNESDLHKDFMESLSFTESLLGVDLHSIKIGSRNKVACLQIMTAHSLSRAR